MRRLLLFCVLILSAQFTLLAEEISFQVRYPRVVATGTIFQIEFELNAKSDRGSFVEPSMGGMKVVAGPATSMSTNVQIVNGKMQNQTLQGWTYNLYCDQQGEFEIGSAVVRVDGKEYKTEPVKIKAIVESNSSGGAATGGGSNAPSQQGGKPSSGGGSEQPVLKEDDMLLVTTLDRSEVYVGQPVVVRYKLYTRVDFSHEGTKMPSFVGFWSHRLNTGANRWVSDEYRGKIYKSCIVGEYLLFPQQAGQMKIEPMEISAIAELPINDGSRRRGSIMDEFFLGQQTKQVPRTLISNSPSLTVKALPEGAPAGYSGAVGDFEMSVTPPAEQIEANSALNYIVKISGSGNFSMIRTPELKLPGTFEQYTAKVSESIQTTSRGVSGYRQFEYPIIARAEGDYVIPAMEFSYFSPKLSKYVTLTSQEYSVSVTPDSTAMSSAGAGVIVGGAAREDLRILGRDIRFISLERLEVSPKGKLFLFSGGYFLILLAELLIFVALVVWLSRYLKQMRNQATLKGKRANKVALARFRAAEGYLRQSNARGFYEEMLKGLWGYLSDKLNIPAADLTKENVRERLAQKGVAVEDVEQYIAIITDCEYAQYAPSGSGRLEEVYIEGVAIISRLEAVINK